VADNPSETIVAPIPGHPKRYGARSRSKAPIAERVAVAQTDVEVEGQLPDAEEHVILARTLYGEWLDGFTIAQLAERHEMSENTVKRIVDPYRQATVRLVPTPAESLIIAHEIVERWERVIGDYQIMIVNEREKEKPNANTMLGAMRGKTEAMKQWVALMQEMSWLPRNLGVLRLHTDTMAMVQAFVDVMDRHNLPIEVQREMVEAAELVAVEHDGKVQVEWPRQELEVQGGGDSEAA
jgi:hypothetical protein